MFSWVGWFLMFCDFEKTFDKLEGWSRWEKMRARRRRKYSLVESFLVELYNIFKRVFLLKVMEWKSGDCELLIARNMGASRKRDREDGDWKMLTYIWLYSYVFMFKEPTAPIQRFQINHGLLFFLSRNHGLLLVVK